MTMLAAVVDAVVGGDTHRDTHALEMLAPNGTAIATLAISNDDDGFAEAIAWIAEHAPGPRIAVGLEGTRSYGIGLARAAASAGLLVAEVERPRRADRRRGKSDPIDTHLAALQVLRMSADRLPAPRADGDREALRILLSARREVVIARTRQVNRLRALLLSGQRPEPVTGNAHPSPSPGNRPAARPRRRYHRAGRAPRRGPAAGDRDPRCRRRASLQQAAAPRDGQRARPRPAGQDRGRTRQRGAGHRVLVAPRTRPQRRRIRRARRSQPRPGQQRPDHPAPPQPRRRPPAQPRPARHHPDPMASRPRTHAYITRRRAAGKSDTEIRRALKRYIARELFRALEAAPAA